MSSNPPPRFTHKPVWVATWFIRSLLMLAARLQIVRVRVVGRSNVPRRGPVIVAANHASIIDPILLFGMLRRRVTFLAADFLFRIFVFGRIMKWMGHIPVYRNTEQARLAAQAGADVLQHRGVLGIFPEGSVAEAQASVLRKAYLGVATMALATGSLIVPVALVGTEKVMPPGRRLLRLFHPRVRIIVGRPIKPLANEDPRALTNRVMVEIARLGGFTFAPAAA